MRYDKNLLYRTDQLADLISQRNSQLKLLLRETEQRIKNAPRGSLHISMRGKERQIPQFYVRYRSSERTGTYLRKGNETLVRRLAQKDYDIKLVRQIRTECLLLQRLLDAMKKNGTLAEIYEKLTAVRRTLVEPAVESDESFLCRWYAEHPPGAEFREEDAVYVTRRGERVRSKSELIIANLLYDHGIPYVYEPQLCFEGDMVLRPDFLVLNVRNRTTFVWEHLGLLDNSGYLQRSLAKQSLYCRSGFYPGINLIFSCESSQYTLKADDIERLIQAYLI